MKLRLFGIFAAVTVVSCAQMQRDWEAQQAAQAQASAQPANMEQLCTSMKNAYCTHCNADQETCSHTYVACIGQSSPADPSSFTVGAVNQCASAVSAGDCSVMPRIWPASCSKPTSQTAAAPAAVTPTITATTTTTTVPVNDPQPAQAAQPAQATQDEPPACPEGASWDGSQCVCAKGTGWDGQACMPLAAQATPTAKPPRLPSCRALVIDKGYGPSATSNCKGAEPLCAKAVLDGGYGPSALSNCHNVNSRCAVLVIKKGYGPSSLSNCQGVETRCAQSVLDKGYGPSSLSKCKH